MMDSDDEAPETHGNMFEDPEDFYPPTPPPTSQTYELKTGQVITLHLVGYSPLEAHHLWQGSRVVARYFEDHTDTAVRDRTVLELGAGAGLPSIVCSVLGARKVVVTDYPDADLVETMWKNVRGCELVPKGPAGEEGHVIVADGYIWGADPTPLLAYLPEQPPRKFDVLILADLLFRHSEHGNMLKTVDQAMRRRRESRAYVFFTSYRPWLREKDLAFFDLARERGFIVDKILEQMMERPLFENDPGDEEVRRTVTGYTLRWPDDSCDEEGA